MPKFHYKAVDVDGKTIKGIFIARDEDDLREIVLNQSYYLISFRKIAESSQMFSFLERVKPDELSIFCRQFAIMLTSGMDITKAVTLLQKSTKTKKLKDILEVVSDDLAKGMNLSDTFAKYPKTFPSFFRNMIKIGETSGQLEKTLVTLADYYDRDTKTKKKVKSALSYPIFLLVLALAVILVISLFIMPQFAKVFNDFGSEMPQITVAFVAFSNFIAEKYKEILLAIIVVVALFQVLNKIKSVRYFFDFMKLRMPLFKDFYIAVYTSRFSSGLQTLISSGLKIVESMDIMAKLLDNLYIEKKLIVCVNEMKRGQGIAKSINTINIFPEMLIEMIRIGEESASLEQILTKTQSYYEDQVDSAIKKLTGAIEPVMIMVIGGIVVLALLSVFLPMMGMTSAIDNSVADI